MRCSLQLVKIVGQSRKREGIRDLIVSIEVISSLELDLPFRKQH